MVYVVHIGPIVLIANAFKYVINILNFILNNSFALSDNNVRYANLGLRKMVFKISLPRFKIPVAITSADLELSFTWCVPT